MKIMRLVVILVAVITITSCEKLNLKNEDYVSVSNNEMYFESDTCSETLIVSSSTTWNIVGVADWTTIYPLTGENGDTIMISVIENDSIEEREATFIVQCGNAATSIRVTQDGKIETDYVDLNLEQSEVTTSYNEATGELTVSYPNSKVPAIESRQAIVLPAEYGYDIRVIESVWRSGNTLTITTSQGNMSNLFRNVSFTLSINPSNSTRSKDGRRVFTPSSYGYIGDDGKYYELYNAETRTSYTANQQLWTFHKDYDGEYIYKGNAGCLFWDKCAFDAELDGLFSFDFGERILTNNDKRIPLGDLKAFSYSLTGNLDVDMQLHYKFENNHSEESDKIIKYNVIPTGFVQFQIGPVPLVIHIYTHLGCYQEFNFNGQLNATTGVKFGTQIDSGLSWTAEGGVVPHYNISPYFDVYPFTVNAEASAEAKISYYPQIEIGIYSKIGPWIEPRPYVKEKVDAGLRASTDGNNYVGWKADGYNGMDLRMGLKFEFGMFDKELWRSNIFNVMEDVLLFEAPLRITTLSPSDGIEVEAGETILVEFIVESYSPLTGKYYPCPLALVNFTAEAGKLSAPIAIADVNGQVSVEWTPSDKSKSTRSNECLNKVLRATIVDKNGISINEATFTALVPNNISIIGKWNCIGTSTPPKVELRYFIFNEDGSLESCYYYPSNGSIKNYGGAYEFNGNVLILYKTNGDIQYWEILELTGTSLVIRSTLDNFIYYFER